MLLTEDFYTSCWKRTAAKIESRIQELRLYNEKELPEIETARVRGGIRELKNILALAENASASHADAPDEISDVQDVTGQWPL